MIIIAHFKHSKDVYAFTNIILISNTVKRAKMTVFSYFLAKIRVIFKNMKCFFMHYSKRCSIMSHVWIPNCWQFLPHPFSGVPTRWKSPQALETLYLSRKI